MVRERERVLPDISIVTAAHINTLDKLEWLKEAIVSVLAQAFTDWEHIVVDDASSYDLEKELADYTHLRYLRASHHQGPAMCRNTAVALARAEAVLALDADDQLPPDALSLLFPAWQADPTRIVYGDLQRLEHREDGRHHLGRSFDLPDYSFTRVMDLDGIIPVTALHSIECHVRAGGWKAELDAGLEDVEKWIAAGKAGFCGHKVSGVTLHYRQHDSSRAFALRRVNRRETEMRNKIREIHADIYERGEFPMGCCPGGTATTNPPPAFGATNPRPTTLDGYPASEKVWVEYLGRRGAQFGVLGQATGIPYSVQGTGHKFEVHVQDAQRIGRLGRGKDFRLGVPPPEGNEPEPEPEPQTDAYQAPEPELAEVVRLDAVALGEEAAPLPEPEPQPTEEWQPVQVQGELYTLDVLELGNLEKMLEVEGWTVNSLAGAEPGELINYKGIGPVRAGAIVEKARQFLAEMA